jgi:hypothetical protein
MRAVAEGLGSATADITTDGGNARIAFTAAPDALTVSTGTGSGPLQLAPPPPG